MDEFSFCLYRTNIVPTVHKGQIESHIFYKKTINPKIKLVYDIKFRDN